MDEGGVAKEFFQLLVRQLFNPDYGMFTADPTSHLHWFRPSRLEMELEFELVGILIGESRRRTVMRADAGASGRLKGRGDTAVQTAIRYLRATGAEANDEHGGRPPHWIGGS